MEFYRFIFHNPEPHEAITRKNAKKILVFSNFRVLVIKSAISDHKMQRNNN
ncbi:hypothetical protein D1BOALGB6SA_9068 [Olavius sp. associated proteobacterium Delta 1]|nr:hypothetical protein D1BOALGB6SA_9068 [Olavius sp. associated proteobacterium Delta 1]